MTDTPLPTIRVLVIDDEALARRNLNTLLMQYDFIDVQGSFENARQALEYINQHEVDLIFLDIQMPGMSGLEMVEHIAERRMPYIVFATAYDQYAVNAFEINALDYLLKPVRKERLDEALRRYHENVPTRQDLNYRHNLLKALEKFKPSGARPRLTIKDGDQHLVLDMMDIQYIESAGNYACVHNNDQVIIVRKTLKKLLAELDETLFTQIHRSILVNLEQVRAIQPHINGEYVLKLVNGERLKVSRTYRKNIQQLLNH